MQPWVQALAHPDRTWIRTSSTWETMHGFESWQVVVTCVGPRSEGRVGMILCIPTPLFLIKSDEGQAMPFDSYPCV